MSIHFGFNAISRYNSLCRVWILILCSTLNLQTSLAQQEPPKPKIPIEILEAQLKVVDARGNPVENAEVFCTGLRTRVNPASHYGWSPARHGEIKKYKTNEHGIVSVEYPKYVDEKLETSRVTWSVEHPGYMSFREDVSVDNEAPELRLKRGFRIALNAVAADSGEKLKTDLHAVMGQSDSNRAWKVSNNGMMISPMLSPDRSVFRLVHLPKDGPSLFSELIVVEPEDRSRVLLKDVKLFPGVRVEGKIDDQVPRPIKNGMVSASFVNNPNEDREAPGSWKGRWEWHDNAKVSEDGTFVFDCVPRDEFIQLYARCDDWSVKRPEEKAVLAEFPQFSRKYNLGWPLPHFEKVSQDVNQITLPMTKNSNVSVTIVDADGKPIVDARVGYYLQELLLGGGGAPFGYQVSTREALISPDEAAQRVRNRRPTLTKTNESGIVVLSVPPAKHVSLLVAAEGYKMKANRDSRSFSFDVEEGKSKEIEVQMEAADAPEMGQPEAKK